MSAFIVSEAHIDALVAYGRRHSISVATPDGKLVYSFDDEADALAMHNELVAENYRSIKARYGSEESAPVISELKLLASIPTYSHVQIWKACHCLNYQSCETSDYSTTFGYRIMKTIEDQAAYAIIGNTLEYNNAKWEITTPALESHD